MGRFSKRQNMCILMDDCAQKTFEAWKATRWGQIHLREGVYPEIFEACGACVGAKFLMPSEVIKALKSIKVGEIYEGQIVLELYQLIHVIIPWIRECWKVAGEHVLICTKIHNHAQTKQLIASTYRNLRRSRPGIHTADDLDSDSDDDDQIPTTRRDTGANMLCQMAQQPLCETTIPSSNATESPGSPPQHLDFALSMMRKLEEPAPETPATPTIIDIDSEASDDEDIPERPVHTVPMKSLRAELQHLLPESAQTRPPPNHILTPSPSATV